MRLPNIWAVAVVSCVTAVAAAQDNPNRSVDFSRDIRPILSDTCFKCHGPDEHHRQTELRLDVQSSVFDDVGVIVPGEPSDSELYLRLVSDDADMVMPPVDSGRQLTAHQIELIRRWIEQGASWGEHWSFVPPRSPRPPQLDSDWPRNPIDQFVEHRQRLNGLQPSPEADRVALVRRLYLDLIGLPPTPRQVDEFLNDTGDAYDNLVDRLLSSPHFGEHMARHWLDVVRYGDTHGLHLDNYREHWPYRDWIIQAFNRNQSFRDFAIEQLAGDLLENPTRDQLTATGFNRAHVTTNEGGSINEEVRVRNVSDRVSTMGTVFLGLTVGCASCHDHKFDPISQKEFYQLFAFFNSLDGDAMDGNRKDPAPVLMVGTDEQMAQLENYQQRARQLENRIKQLVATWQYVEPDDPPAVVPDPLEEIWLDDELPESETRSGNWHTVETTELSGTKAFVSQSDGFIQDVIQFVKSPWTVAENDELFAYVYLDPQQPPREIMLQWNDGNWEHRIYWGENLINFGRDGTPSRKHMGSLPAAGTWHRISVPAAEVNLRAGQVINGFALSQFGGRVLWDKVGRVTQPPAFAANRSLEDWIRQAVETKGSGLPGAVKEIVGKKPSEWTEADQRKLREHFVEFVYAGSRGILEPLKKQLQEVAKLRDDLKRQIPTTLIYRETSEPRVAHFLERGQYDQPGDAVERHVPAVFSALPEGAPVNRLGLAMWLFSGEHPLTARVVVNRYWQQLFGRGLVATSEDFGSQGQFPSHPDLLDHLATEFVKHDWDVKWLIKYLVTSATYRQSARQTQQHWALDPQNRLLARSPRYRLDAETLRDQALAVSGLLVPKIGGPSVKPPQPDGLWFVVGYSGSNTVRFKKDEGHDKVHRRSLYTFWKRTAPPPQMSIFDAPSREECIVRRERTNTPLQALMLMNDPQYVEAARYLAQMLIDDNPTSNDTTRRIDWLYRRCLGRPAKELEHIQLNGLLTGFREQLAVRPDNARALLQIGEVPAAESYDAVELASWTMVANLLMNLDEFVNKN